MLRFVLRTTKYKPLLESQIITIRQEHPEIEVISLNIQPAHAAILEGKQEIILTSQQHLSVKINHIPLFIRAGSFFQTNSLVASQLYLTAQKWTEDLPIKNLWDLFCGSGGFGLHCVKDNIELVGIEINQDSINCAKKSAELINHKLISFRSLDASDFALSQSIAPNLILVNPPRRGIGEPLANYLVKSAPPYILYSSCNVVTLSDDIKKLTNYQITRVQLFDMFPHSEHMEVLVLLSKKTN